MFCHNICTGLINGFPWFSFGSERSGKFVVLFLLWQQWQFFEGLPLVLKRKIVEYSATHSLNHWTSNFHFQQMNTEEFIDFKIYCYLSANLISPCSFNTWLWRRNARVNIKGCIKHLPPHPPTSILPFSAMFGQMLVWFSDSNEHFWDWVSGQVKQL